MSVSEIEAAITRLAPDEKAQLTAWLARQQSPPQETNPDPLLALLGTIKTDVPDVAARHDEYLGQALDPRLAVLREINARAAAINP